MVKNYGQILLNLSFDRVLKNPSFDGGRVELTPSPQFSFVKTIEKVIRLCTALIFFFLNGIFEDMGIFHVFYLSVMGRYNPPLPSKLS